MDNDIHNYVMEYLNELHNSNINLRILLKEKINENELLKKKLDECSKAKTFFQRFF